MGGIAVNVQVTVQSFSRTVEDSVSSEFLISGVDPSNASSNAAAEGMIPSHQVGPQTSTVGSVFKDLSNFATVKDLCVGHVESTPAISAVNDDLSIEVTASIQGNARASASTVSPPLVANEDKNVEAVAECNCDAKNCISDFDEMMSDETEDPKSVQDVAKLTRSDTALNPNPIIASTIDSPHQTTTTFLESTSVTQCRISPTEISACKAVAQRLIRQTSGFSFNRVLSKAPNMASFFTPASEAFTGFSFIKTIVSVGQSVAGIVEKALEAALKDCGVLLGFDRG
ncbi:hypothetical protein HDU67_004948, partial [Dinochytrium kinnereticum]